MAQYDIKRLTDKFENGDTFTQDYVEFYIPRG